MHIVWRTAALNDLLAILAFISNDNSGAADHVNSTIRVAVSQLAHNPNLGRAGRVDNTRELLIPRIPYIVAYSILDGEVQILAVHHTSRRWPPQF